MPFKDPEKRREMSRIYSQRWREKNPEKVRAKWAAWREKNAEYDRERSARYRAEHREERREAERLNAKRWRAKNPGYSKVQYAANPERFKAKVEKRRALKRGAGVTEEIVPLVVLERDDGVCGICGDDVDPLNFHVDHIIPLARGGSHTYGNVQVAHPSCNCRKRDQLPQAA